MQEVIFKRVRIGEEAGVIKLLADPGANCGEVISYSITPLSSGLDRTIKVRIDKNSATNGKMDISYPFDKRTSLIAEDEKWSFCIYFANVNSHFGSPYDLCIEIAVNEKVYVD